MRQNSNNLSALSKKFYSQTKYRMQKEGSKLNDEQIKQICEAGYLTMRQGAELDGNQEFSNEYFLIREGGDEYYISMKVADCINNLIKEQLEDIKYFAPMELKLEVETLFKYKALNKEDKISILKQFHSEEWNRFEENLIDSSWEIAYVGSSEYFQDSFKSAIRSRLEEILYWIFFEPQEYSFLGPYKHSWYDLIYDEVRLAVQKYTSLCKIEFLKEQLSIYASEGQVNDSYDEEYAGSDLALKQQVLLLERLGIFELPIVKQLTETQKGKVFGYLLNRNHKNTEDAIRYRNMNKNQVPKDSNFVRTEKNLNRVSEILKEVGLDKK